MSADDPYRRFFWLIIGIGITGIVTGIGSAMKIAVSQSEQAVRIESLTLSLAELRVTISESAKNRYTREEANADRLGSAQAINIVQQTIAEHGRQITEISKGLAILAEKLSQLEKKGKP